MKKLKGENAESCDNYVSDITIAVMKTKISFKQKKSTGTIFHSIFYFNSLCESILKL